MRDLPLVFLVGVLGSAHCVGMCGGLVAAVVATGERAQALRRQALYLLGKTTTYAAAGALAGLAGSLVTDLIVGLEVIVAGVVGVALVAVGLGLCGAGRGLGAGRVGGRLAARLSGAVGRLLQRGDAAGLFGLGLVNGLLPCALVMGMTAKAATTGSAWMGAATMAAFGLGTVPALVATGLLGALLPATRRHRLQLAGGVLVVGLGVLTLARAATGLGLVAPGPAASAWLCLPG